MGTFLGSLGSAAMSGLTGGVSGGISGAVSGLMGMVTGGLGARKQYKYQKRLMNQQQEYNKEIMGIQNEYQQAAAAKEQEYNKEMWDYTNAKNQVKHLKEAGLNPALIYGMNGGGGAGTASAGGANVQSPTIYGGNPVEMGLRGAQLEQDRRRQEAEINLMNSEATRNRVEAEKTEGVDTKKVYAEIEKIYKEAETEVEKKNYFAYSAKMANAKTITENAVREAYKQKTWNEVEKIQQEAHNYMVRSLNIAEDSDIKRGQKAILYATIDEQIQSYSLSVAYQIASIARQYSDIDVNEAEIQNLAAGTYEYLTRSGKNIMDAENYGKFVKAQAERWSKQSTNERTHNIIYGVDVAIRSVNESFNTIGNNIGFLKWFKGN